jgi:DNA-binding NtrC family response regulator
MNTILIVEDDKVLAGVLQTAFRRSWNVEMAANADEALATFREAPPDLVLTDKNMPGMNGLELLHAIRRLDPHVGMVVMTAFGTEESAGDAFNVGVDAYVEKPFPDLIAFVAEMQRLCERVTARRVAGPRPKKTTLHIFAATSDDARKTALAEMFYRIDTIEWFASFDALVSATAGGTCQAVVVDCGSLTVAPDEAAVALDARKVPTIIVAEGLRVPEITRLIDLGVKSLVNAPLDNPRAAEILRSALTRIRDE